MTFGDRRAPLRRGKALGAGKPRKPLPSTSAKRRSEAPARAALRQRVLARDAGCVPARRGAPGRCWHPLELTELDVHEVISRGQWRAGFLVDENCMSSCRRHHDWITNATGADRILAIEIGVLARRPG